MAGVSGGFRIREFVSKMRSVDVEKCWPFSDKFSKEDMAAMLPPMPVNNSTDCFQELEAMKAKQPDKGIAESSTLFISDNSTKDDKSELGCPVCKNFTAVTVNALNAHIDSCLAQTSRKGMKGRPRARKKRSIVEIFAEAPHVQKAEDDVNASKNQKMKKIKKTKQKDGVTIKKKKRQELDSTPLAKVTRMVTGPSGRGRSTLEILDAGASGKKKSSLKSSKKKLLSPSKSIGKKQKPMSTVHGILKNHRKETGQNSSSVRNMLSRVEQNPRSSQQSKRHVSFLDASHALAEKEQFSEGSTESTAVEVNTSDDHGLDSARKEAGIHQVIEKKQRQDSRDNVVSEFLRLHINCQEEVNPLPEKFLASCQAALRDGILPASHKGLQNAPAGSPYDGSPGHFSALNRRILSTQDSENPVRFLSSLGLSTDHSEDQALAMAVTGSGLGTRAFLQPSSPLCPINENRNEGVTSQSRLSTENSSGYPMGCQPLFCPPPGNIIGKMHNYPEHRHGYFGLPLNSQGELIHLGSSSRYGFSQPILENMVSSSSTGLPSQTHYNWPNQYGDYGYERNESGRRTLQRTQLNLFPADGHEENLEVNLPSRFLANVGTAGRGDVHCLDTGRWTHFLGCQPNSDLSPWNMSCHGCNRAYELTPNQRRNGMLQPQNLDHNAFSNAQPTMRLMGKDLAVGQDNKLTPVSSFQQDRSVPTTVVKLKEPASDFQAFGRCFMIKSPEPTYPYMSWNTNSGLRSGNLDINENCSSEGYHFADPSSAAAMFSRAPYDRDPFGRASKPMTASFQSFVPSIYQNSCPHMQYRAAEDLRNKQSFIEARKPVFEFPFLYPDKAEQSQPVWFQNASEGPSPWLLHGARQYQPSKMSPQLRSLTCPEAAGPCHPVVPVLPAPGGMPTRDNMKLKAVIKEPGQSSKSRKRPAATGDVSTRLSRVPNINLQENSGALEIFGTEVQRGLRVSDSNLNRDKTRNAEDGLHIVPLDLHKHSSGAESFRSVVNPGSGFIKLSPGAKHILNPSQNVYKDNPRLIRTILPSASTHPDRSPETQKKS